MKTSRRTLLTAAALAAFTPRLSEAQPTQEKPMTTHTYHDAILHYRDNGKTDAPALLLLHGGLGTAAGDFAPLLPRLHPHYRVKKTTRVATANPRAAASPSPTRKSPLTPNTSSTPSASTPTTSSASAMAAPLLYGTILVLVLKLSFNRIFTATVHRRHV